MKIQFDSAMPASEATRGTVKTEGSGTLSDAEKRDVNASVSTIQKHLDRLKETNFQLEFDKEIDRVIVKYKNVDGQVVRQIPSEQFVEFERAFVQTIGMFYDRKV